MEMRKASLILHDGFLNLILKGSNLNLEWQMTKDEKIQAVIAIVGIMGLFLKFLFDTTIMPYLIVQKAEKRDFKTTCAYVLGTEKMKYSYKYVIRIDEDIYYHIDILPSFTPWASSDSLQGRLMNFPIREKNRDFLEIEPNKCKKINYVEIYNFLVFRKIYIYDFIK